MSSSTYSLSHQAYLKIIFHAAKYPSSLVNGLLLTEPSSSRQQEGSSIIVIVDAIPLLHHWTSLSPSMEIGLELAEFHASSKGLVIAGYYQADEKLEGGDDAGSLSFVGSTVASQIRQRNGGNGIAILMDNELLATSSNPFVALSPSSSSSSTTSIPIWSPSNTVTLSLQDPESPRKALELVRTERDRLGKFGDFDDHLEDVTIDWLNQRIALTGLLSSSSSI